MLLRVPRANTCYTVLHSHCARCPPLRVACRAPAVYKQLEDYPEDCSPPEVAALLDSLLAFVVKAMESTGPAAGLPLDMLAKPGLFSMGPISDLRRLWWVP